MYEMKQDTGPEQRDPVSEVKGRECLSLPS